MLVVLLLLLPASGCAWLSKTSVSGPLQAQRLLEQALAARERKDDAHARDCLLRAVENNPRNPEIRWELVRQLMAEGDMDGATEQLRQLVEFNPDDSRAYIRLSETLFQQHRYGDADRLLDLAMERDPHNAEALILRGDLYQVWGQEDRALAHYHRALLSEPDDVSAVLKIAEIQLRRGQGEQAAPLLRKIEDHEGISLAEQRQVHWMLGQAYAQTNRWEQATTQLALGIDAGDVMPDQLYQLAYARAQAGDWEQAGRDLQEALRLQPRHERARELWARLPQQLPGETRSAIIPAEHMTPQ